MSHTIHNFLELKALCNKRVIGRYDSAELALANQAEVEYDDEAENPGASCGELGPELSNIEAESSPLNPAFRRRLLSASTARRPPRQRSLTCRTLI